ncbi:MAG TPA: hypothetical protein VG276_04905 [Actinomycetes bacterium]|nr:hypothetical protein [Actinomycetes bacterium]
MLPTRPLRAVLTVMLMVFATMSSRIQHALLCSKHWLTDGPALRAGYAAAVWAAVALLVFAPSKIVWG